jgi:DNA replication ATP-dependent helicase Dna2
VDVRGRIEHVGETRSVETDGGTRDLVECRLSRVEATAAGEPAPPDPATVTLWGDWADTAHHAAPGMDLRVTDVGRDTYQGETTYATTADSYVVLEPDFLVDVTGIRSWVQCPRMYYLNKLGGTPLVYPVVRGTIVHEVFGDLLRGRDLDAAVDDHVADAGAELGLLDRDPDAVREEVRGNASAIQGWLAQETFGEDEWRSEQTLLSETFGIKGRADAVRNGDPVELKTGKNLGREPRFHDKVQAACYALLLRERGLEVDTGTLLYTKNATVDRGDASGDLSPAKEFSIGKGLLDFVVRERNALAAMEHDCSVPTGHEADADCNRCFEQDTCMVVSGRLDQESKAGQIGTAVPPEERRYVDGFYRAIEAERVATHREYAKLWRQSAADRAADDRALLDLTFEGATQLDGGRWELRATRSAATVSKIREGDRVLASDGDPVAGTAELARVERLDDERVVLTADERVAVTRLDVYPSELSVDRLLTALHDGILKGPERRKDVLFGRAEPTFDDPDETFVPNNAAQDRAVRRAVGAEDCALVHGPPGTGKTRTAACIVAACVERGERVLVSALTNTAVDNLVDALRARLDDDAIVRYGTESGVGDHLEPLRFDRRGDPAERAAALEDAAVVAATTAGCGSRLLRALDFDVALVDEAGQLTEPGTLAAINRAERFVLVGDHNQLPPVVQSESGTATGSGSGGRSATDSAPVWTEPGSDEPAALGRSLLERLIGIHPDASVLLDRQYRMSQRIQAFPSAEFYDGRLRPATPEIASQSLSDLDGVDPEGLPADLQDPVALRPVSGGQSGNANPREAETVAEAVDALVAVGVSPADIGVIAPFRAQVATIDRALDRDLVVDTVDRFQGSAREAIVVSFVASGSLDSPVFDDHRRANVALTRAKRQLVLVGDPDALAEDPVYARMVEWAR